jgi:V/A-type H+-transporting ATPase subunit D
LSSLNDIRPTKGYLLDLKRRIVFVEKGYELLKLKRDNLAKELKDTIEALQGKRQLLDKDLNDIYVRMSIAKRILGLIPARGYALTIQNQLQIETVPTSFMGVNYPQIRLVSKPPFDDTTDVLLKPIIEDVYSLIRQILQLAELEAKIERIAEEFGRTNRKVNVLRDIIIPNYHERIQAITEKLDSEILEELVRLKVSRTKLERKRQ